MDDTQDIPQEPTNIILPTAQELQLVTVQYDRAHPADLDHTCDTCAKLGRAMFESPAIRAMADEFARYILTTGKTEAGMHAVMILKVGIEIGIRAAQAQQSNAH